MPYLEIQNAAKEEKIQISVPNLIGKTISEAESEMKEINLEVQWGDEEQTDKTKVITKQTPQQDVLVDEGTAIIVHTN